MKIEIIVRLDDQPVEDLKVESESFDFKKIRDIGFLAKFCSINLPSQSDLDNGREAGDEHRQNHDLSMRTSEMYDRESILYQLAKLRDSSIIKSILNIERIRKKSKNSIKNVEWIEDTRTSENFKEYSKLEFEEFRDALQGLPDWMLHLLTGLDHPGDCGRVFDQKPDWLDTEKLRRGQKFVEDHIFPVFFVEVISLSALFSFGDAVKPVVFTGNSSTPYAGFKKVLSTVLRQQTWYTQDFWAKDSDASKELLTTRAIHGAVSRKMDALTDEEINDRTKIPEAWCPLQEILIEDFSENYYIPAIGQCPYMTSRNNSSRVKSINQTDMALTQWCFVSLIICFPKRFGIHYASDEDLDAYCYFWRNVGYRLGIEDQYNFCRGTFEDIRQRSHDLLELWIKPNFREIRPEWEHVMRCIVTGCGTIVPISCHLYEITFLYLAETMGLKMPRLYASLSYKDWIIYNFIR